jgi:dihydroorotate dehydrogenase
MEAVGLRLARLNRSGLPGPLGVNLGKNKEQPNAVVDYCRGLFELGGLADYIVVNVSSPNTPGLRQLQGRHELQQLLSAVKQTRDALEAQRPPILVKIAPDMSQGDLEDVVAAVQSTQIDGIIVSNTTVARPDHLRSPHAAETGGLSGAPLFDSSTRVLKEVYRLTHGKVPLVGVGGVDSGATAYAKIRAGASLVQLYTALSLQGPAVLYEIKRDLALLLQRDGFTSVSQAVGADVQLPTRPQR